MKVRDNGFRDFRTKRQWAIRGYLPKPGERGTSLWANRYCQAGYLYYAPDQVEQAGPEALADYFKPERERRNQRARELRRKKKEQTVLEQQHREKEKLDAAIHKAVSPYLMQVSELRKIIRDLTQQLSPDCAGGKSIVVDTETTGLDPELNELLQCSIIDTDGNILFHSYIKPSADEWTEAEAVNRISSDMVRDAPAISECRDEISRILCQASTIIGYNTSFDLDFLTANGIVIPNGVGIVDVMRLFAPIYGEWSEKLEDYKWQSLIYCAGHYGYDWSSQEGEAHDSLADCYATLYCYHKIEEECGDETQESHRMPDANPKWGITDRG